MIKKFNLSLVLAGTRLVEVGYKYELIKFGLKINDFPYQISLWQARAYVIAVGILDLNSKLD